MTRFLPFGSRSKTIQVNTLGGGGGGVPRDGLVAEYLLATNSLDTSGNGNNGVDTNITYDGLSASFNGTTSKIVSQSNSGFTGDKVYSISTWIYLNSTKEHTAVALGAQTAAGTQLNLVMGNHGFYGDVSCDTYASVAGINNRSLTTTGQWYHIVMCHPTGSTSGIQLYFNGTLYATADIYGGFTTLNLTNSPFYIGSYAGGQFLDGKMKKVRIYNRVLNAGEIAALYADA